MTMRCKANQGKKDKSYLKILNLGEKTRMKTIFSPIYQKYVSRILLFYEFIIM